MNNPGNASTSVLGLTAEQLEQLLKLLPQSSSVASESKYQSETNDEIDAAFPGNMYCLSIMFDNSYWILDTGAIDYVTPSKINLQQAKNVTTQSHINLPNGNIASVTCLVKVKLNDGVELKDVLYVPSFKLKLLSVSKLTKDSKYIVIFYDTFCVIQDYVTNKVRGIGQEYKGLFYLDNRLHNTQSSQATSQILMMARGLTCGNLYKNEGNLWHHRLGHVPFSRLKHVQGIKACKSQA